MPCRFFRSAAGPAIAAAAILLVALAAPLAARATSANAPIADCDDTNPNVYPGAPEIADNGIDDNCNGLADEAPDGTPSSNFLDNDSDGVSVAAGDCNDHNPGMHPGAAEILDDLVDNDCNGLADDTGGVPPSGTVDMDGDGVPRSNVRIFGNDFEI
jgi:hypothetical protein